MIEIKNISENIKRKGIKHVWLMDQLGISRRTFYKRMKSKMFRKKEYETLKKLGLS